jgi:nucleoside-diphosphate-sugar epimerase
LAYVIKYCLDNDIYDNINVATEENYTIKEIAEIVIKIIGEGKITDINFDVTKPDGQYRKDVSIDNLKKLIPNFKTTSLSDGITKTIKNLNFNNI